MNTLSGDVFELARSLTGDSHVNASSQRGTTFWKVSLDGKKIGINVVTDSGVGYAVRSRIKSGLTEAKAIGDRIQAKSIRKGMTISMPGVEDVVVVDGRNIGYRATRWVESIDGETSLRIMDELGIGRSR